MKDDHGEHKAVALKLFSANSSDCYQRETAARDGLSNARGTAIVQELRREDYSKNVSAMAEALPGTDGLRVADYPFCLTMEQGARSLDEANRAEQFSGRDVARVSNIMRCIATRIAALHGQGWMHGDIKV